MAFVVVTHLHPKYESHLAELLQQHTQMSTRQVTRRIKVEANHVYVIPPNRTIILTDTHLETAEFTELHGRRSPIDYSKGIRPQIIERLQKESILNNLELQVKRESGETTTVVASIQLIMIDQMQALLMSFIDISERVRAEQQIHALAYELTRAEQAERQRISRILHDDLQQRIFAAKVQTRNIEDDYRQGNLETAQADLSQLRSMLDESISITRSLSIDLSPAILQGEGLSDALQWLANQMHEQYDLEVSIQTNGVSTRFEDTLRILLFHAVREALFNIVKHAETLHAAVTVEKADPQVQIIVSDGGAGFQSDAVAQGIGMGGLAHIQRRLNLMGCSLRIQSQPGDGTRVIIQVPSHLVLS